jgi:hypothetical protein
VGSVFFSTTKNNFLPRALHSALQWRIKMDVFKHIFVGDQEG